MPEFGGLAGAATSTGQLLPSQQLPGQVSAVTLPQARGGCFWYFTATLSRKPKALKKKPITIHPDPL